MEFRNAMTYEDTSKILTVLKTAYPKAFTLPASEARKLLDLWHEMLSEYDTEIAAYATKNYIKHNRYPPTIAGLVEEIEKLTDTNYEMELWSELSEAVSRGTVFTQADFDRLSEPLKLWLKNPKQVRELALISSETFQTVTKGQFLRTINNVIDRQKALSVLPDDIKDKLTQSIKLIG